MIDIDIDWFDLGVDATADALRALAETESTDGFERKSAPIGNNKFLSKPDSLSQPSIRRATALDKEFWSTV